MATPVPSSTDAGLTPTSVNNTQQMSRGATFEIIGSPTTSPQIGASLDANFHGGLLAVSDPPSIPMTRQDTQPHATADSTKGTASPAESSTNGAVNHNDRPPIRVKPPRPPRIALPDVTTPSISVPQGPRMPAPHATRSAAMDIHHHSDDEDDEHDNSHHDHHDVHDNDDDILNRPGLRVSGIFGITLIIGIFLVVGLWQGLGSNFSGARLRSDAIESGNHLASVGIRWAALMSSVQQRYNMTTSLYKSLSNDSLALATLTCNLGAFELDAIIAVPLGVDHADTIPVYCQDTHQETSTFTFFQSSLSGNSTFSSVEEAQSNGTALALSCQSRCPTQNSHGGAKGNLYSSMIERVVYDQQALRNDLTSVYPLVNFSASQAEAQRQLRDAAKIDPTLFNIRVFPANPPSLLVFTWINVAGDGIGILSMSRDIAFSQIFGFDNNLGAGNSAEDVVQPFRFSSTTLFVENAVPSAEQFAFRTVVEAITAGANFPYRPYVTNSLRAVLTTDELSTTSLTGDLSAGLVSYFTETCLGEQMPSRYSTFLDYPFHIVNQGWDDLQQLLPNAGIVTPDAVSYSLQITPLSETVVMCGQVCQVPINVSYIDYTGNPANMGSKLSSRCPVEAGQRIFVIAYSSDTGQVLAATDSVLNAFGWCGIVIVILLHGWMYAIIAVPIRYLRSRVLCTLQERPLRFALARHLVIKLTRRLWLGEVRSLTNAVAAILLQYHENNRYVPDYVKRRQHNEKLMVVLAEADRFESYQVANGTFGATGQQVMPSGPPPPPAPRGLHTNSHNAPSALVAAGEGGSRGANLDDAHVPPPSSSAADRGKDTTGPQAAGRPLKRANIIPPSPLVPVTSAAAFAEMEVRMPKMSRGTNMALVPSATVLVMSLRFLETKYMEEFAKTEAVHMRIVATLLSALRKYRGEPFGKDGIVGGASWNAFEPDAYHVHNAVLCALECASLLKPLRDLGHRVGISVHTGPLVSGVVGDAYSVVHVVLGKTSSLAMHLAELNRQMTGVSMLVTQPVHQATSHFHEFLLVDSVVSQHDTWVASVGMLYDVRPGRSRSAPDERPVALTSAHLERNAFTEKYNTAFAQFRAHDFAGALVTMNDILRVDDEARLQLGRPNFEDADKLLSRRNDALFARLYRLILYYRRQPDQLPNPYARMLPAWHLVEKIADEGIESDAFASSLLSVGGSGTNAALGLHRSSSVFAREPTQAAEMIVDITPAPDHTSGQYVTPRAAANAEMEASFRTQLAHAMKQRRGHKRTDSGVSNTGPGKVPNKANPCDPNVSEASNATETPRVAVPTSSAASAGLPPPAQESSSSALGTPTVSEKGTPRGGGESSTVEVSPPQHVDATVLPPAAPPQQQRLDDTIEFANSSTRQFQRGAGESLLRWGGRKQMKQGMQASPGMMGASPGMMGASPGMTGASPGMTGASPGMFGSTPVMVQSTPMSLTATQRRKLAAHNKRLDATATGFAGTGQFSMLPTTPGPQAAGAPQKPSFVLITEGELTDDALGSPLGEVHDDLGIAAFDLIPEGELTDVEFAAKGRSLTETGNGFEDSLGASRTTRPRVGLPEEFVASNGSRYRRSATILGRGTYGTVLMGMETHSGRIVALKVLPLPEQHDPEEFRHLANEVEIMQRVRDQNVVEFYGYHIVGDHILLIMEFVSAGSLDAILRSFKQLSTLTTVNYLRDILHGLIRLHSEGIIHRDVKPQNVLVTTAGVCKLTDFGASALLNAMVRGEGTVEGTPLYLSPEAARGQPQFKSDVWAVGIMFLQLISGCAPYDVPPDMSPDIFVFQVGSGILKPIWADVGLVSHAEEFVRSCLEPDPEKRKSATDLLLLPFFSVVAWPPSRELD